jgi:hypothetical protein
MDRKIIDEYEAGGERLRSEIAGLSQEDLLWRPPADAGIGLWSIQQIIIHLLDSDLIWTIRMKCIIAEDHPKMLGFNESKFAAKLFYEHQDAQRAIDILDLNRRQFAKVLLKLPDSAFGRTGEHNEQGSITLEQSLRRVTEHIENHLEFVEIKRERLGKPLSA